MDGEKKKSKILERLKLGIETFKAAKILWSLIALLTAYVGFNEATKPSDEPVAAVDEVENLPLIVSPPQKDWLPIIRQEISNIPETNWLPVIKEEIRKSNKQHSHEHHGDS